MRAYLFSFLPSVPYKAHLLFIHLPNRSSSQFWRDVHSMQQFLWLHRCKSQLSSMFSDWFFFSFFFSLKWITLNAFVWNFLGDYYSFNNKASAKCLNLLSILAHTSSILWAACFLGAFHLSPAHGLSTILGAHPNPELPSWPHLTSPLRHSWLVFPISDILHHHLSLFNPAFWGNEFSG